MLNDEYSARHLIRECFGDRLQERERAAQAELALEEERRRAQQAEAKLQALRQRLLEQGIDPSTLE
jgi:hypothetical protein